MAEVIAVVIPTVEGREEHLARCVDAYAAPGVQLIVEHDHPSCGAAWIAGAARAVGCEFLHFSADDLEPHKGWAEPAMEAVDQGFVPAPLVFEPNGNLQSAGIEGFDCYRGPYEDWMEIEHTTVPFLSWAQWERIGMVPLHYCTDLWVSHQARRHGWPCRLRTEFAFTHHNAPREDQHGRTNRDRRAYLDLVA